MWKPMRLWIAVAGTVAVAALTLAPAALADHFDSEPFSYGPEPFGIACGSGASAFEVYDRASGENRTAAYYDQNGNFLRFVIHSSASGQFSNPLTGATVPYSVHQTVTFTQTVPGDFSSPVIINVVGELNAVAPGLGAVFVNAGQVIDLFNGQTDTFLKIAGRQELWDYFNGDASAAQKLCTALGAA